MAFYFFFPGKIVAFIDFFFPACLYMRPSEYAECGEDELSLSTEGQRAHRLNWSSSESWVWSVEQWPSCAVPELVACVPGLMRICTICKKTQSRPKKKKKRGWGGDITIMISCWYKPCDFSYVKVHRYAMPQWNNLGNKQNNKWQNGHSTRITT